jgi:spore germination cell wall hydrolase CwlJ-like protein
MKLAWILWLANVMPQPVADPICLTTTIYLEARNQSILGQRAVAEVALRRVEDGRWGDSVCAVVTAPRQFAPTLVSGEFTLKSRKAWDRAAAIAFDALRDWDKPLNTRRQVVPGASHFLVNDIVKRPNWAQGTPVALIGDHAFYSVNEL